MSKFQKFIRPKDLNPVMQAFSARMALHYRAEIAETLIRGKAGPVSFKHAKSETGEKTKSMPELVLEMAKPLGKRQRQALIRQLMNSSTERTPLTSADKVWLRRHVDAKSKVPLAERSKLLQDLSDLIRPKDEIKKGDNKALYHWIRWICGTTLPECAFDGIMDEDTGNEGGSGGTPTPATVPYANLSFVVDRLFCADTTNGEAGNDEISFQTIHTNGPTAFSSSPITANGQRSAMIDAGSFADGTTNNFSPDLIMHTWPLNGLTLPHMFVTFFAMAETDPSGGFSSYTSDLLTNLDADMASIWRELVGMWTILAVWSIGTGAIAGGPIGLLIGVIIAAAFGVFYLIIGAFVNYDDVFDLGQMVVILDENTPDNPPFFGNTRSMSFTDRMSGDGGAYDVTYHWQLS